MWTRIEIFVVAALSLTVPPVLADGGKGGRRWVIESGGVRTAPVAGEHAPLLDEDHPFVVQFVQLPDARRRARLAEVGLELSQYVGGNAYRARCRDRGCELAGTLSAVRATIAITPRMKRSRAFDSSPALAERLRSGRVVRAHLVFSPGLAFADAERLLVSEGVPVGQSRFGSGRSLQVDVTAGQLQALLERPEVEWADPALPPTGPTTWVTARRLGVDRVRGVKAFRVANGKGVGVAVVDNFPADTHTDLENRVTRVRVRPSIDHGTAMSGVIAGAGILDPRYRGMAPKARLFWYSQVWDPWLELQEGRDRYGFSIVSNSWTITVGWWFQIDDPDYNGHWSWREDTWAYGYYHALAAAGDEMIRDSDLLVVFSAANQRGRSFLGTHSHGDAFERDDGLLHEDLHPPNPDYTSIAGHAIAKNVLTVGGTTKEDAMTHFSSWGPTLDGRVKPEVVATALEVFHLKHSDGHGVGSGTSASAAAASGTAALLSDYYRRRRKEPISSVMLKNLMIHSARDLGTPGPDHATGFGLIDAELAARVVRDSPSLLTERAVDHRQKHAYAFTVERDLSELRATLVWHDVAGPRLVNDLDLWLVDPNGKKYRPYTLAKQSPGRAARRGRNRVDNVERVPVPDPRPGDWRIVVKGQRVPAGPQSYSLIVSAGEGNRLPWVIDQGECSIGTFFTTADWYDSDSVSAKNRFRRGDVLNLHMRARVSANPDYGDFYGSVRGTFLIKDQAGRRMLRSCYETHGHDSLDPRLTGFYPWSQYRIPAEMAPGSYLAEGILTLPNGCRARATYPFRVE